MEKYEIKVRLTDRGGYRRFFVVDAMVLNLNAVQELRHVNRASKGVTVYGHVEHYDEDDMVVTSLKSQQFSFTASEKLAQVSTGRVEAPLVEDVDPESMTFATMIPDPDFLPYIVDADEESATFGQTIVNPDFLPEFVLLAETATTGQTLWQEISTIIQNYVLLVQDYGRLD